MKAVFQAHGLPMAEYLGRPPPRVAPRPERVAARVAGDRRLSLLREAGEPGVERRHQQGPRRSGAAGRRPTWRQVTTARSSSSAPCGRARSRSACSATTSRSPRSRRDHVRERVVRLLDEIPRGPGQDHGAGAGVAGDQRQIRELGVAAFRAIDCSGMARVDFFLEDDRVLINEITRSPASPRRAATPGCGKRRGSAIRR